MENEKLQLLHDHYKETFALIHDREQQRDRLFLVVIGLYGLLALAILFSISFNTVLKNVEVAGTKVDLSTLPAGAILGALWAFTFTITLRYCQVSIVVERQYSYLHSIEEHVSAELGGDGIYEREGRAYLENYPAFSTWAWISYAYTFPLILTLVTIALIVTEWLRIPSGWTYKALDTTLAAATCTTLILYRFLPALRKLYKRTETHEAATGD